jgi:hypothetical protein
MSQDQKTFPEFTSFDESYALQAAFYESMLARLKPKGSNYTPPKKKRKKKK